ncbi:DNA-binding helix-turn-helix protein [Streptococcus constellatus subsp. pharyngis SK1060 = CCUG 46377]|uniref:DNA-binding helix-turn-helix protein n=1 Tax=Streptococcus constellatus subsp. pharyngis SK1060 = CCUG 46377 TaxID=1035184 RepID=F9P493_STRCV|nr:DNA-binding helix-turn-helix protein [Streptococcus constellatus subsp. pharyngis SK1060 = CCUG 46377]
MKELLRDYIGKRIRLLRLERGMTQEQLEERADLGTNYVYKLEHLAPNVKINTLERVMQALEVDIETFFDMVPDKEKEDDLTQLVQHLKSLPQENKESD